MEIRDWGSGTNKQAKQEVSNAGDILAHERYDMLVGIWAHEKQTENIDVNFQPSLGHTWQKPYQKEAKFVRQTISSTSLVNIKEAWPT